MMTRRIASILLLGAAVLVAPGTPDVVAQDETASVSAEVATEAEAIRFRQSLVSEQTPDLSRRRCETQIRT